MHCGNGHSGYQVCNACAASSISDLGLCTYKMLGKGRQFLIESYVSTGGRRANNTLPATVE